MDTFSKHFQRFGRLLQICERSVGPMNFSYWCREFDFSLACGRRTTIRKVLRTAPRLLHQALLTVSYENSLVNVDMRFRHKSTFLCHVKIKNDAYL